MGIEKLTYKMMAVVWLLMSVFALVGVLFWGAWWHLCSFLICFVLCGICVLECRDLEEKEKEEEDKK